MMWLSLLLLYVVAMQLLLLGGSQTLPTIFPTATASTPSTVPTPQTCLDTKTAKLDEDHEDTLKALTDLGMVYKNKGQYDKAEPMYKDCLDKRIAKLGEDHPDTLSSMNNLALLYYSQGRYDEAEPLFKKCLDTRTTKLGAEHPDTLATVERLVDIYRGQRKYDQVENLKKAYRAFKN